MQLMTARQERQLIFSFVHYIKKTHNIKYFADIIIGMAKNILYHTEDLKDIQGISRDLSTIIFALYDECSGSDGQILNECLDVWDIMFEKHIGTVRDLTNKIMEL